MLRRTESVWLLVDDLASWLGEAADEHHPFGRRRRFRVRIRPSSGHPPF
jgi:hypothetical protein